MDEGKIFLIVWFVATGIIIFVLYKKGRKALSIFPPIEKENVLYRDKSASGYSTKSLRTKLGGSSKTLEIVVTDKELWLTSKLLLASIGESHDLLHKISLDNIEKIERNGTKFTINFKTDTGEAKQVVLCPKQIDKFIKVLNI
jgi:hypothetical protein